VLGRAAGCRALRVTVSGALLAALVAGCGTHRTDALRVDVTPTSALVDEPLHVQVSGAPAGAQTSVTVESTDTAGAVWRSSARIRADEHGELDTATDASRAGTYTGVSGAGVVWSMHPANGAADPYRWPKSGPATFRVTVRVGGSTASTSFERTVVPPSVRLRSLSLTEDGFVGLYASGPAAAGPRPAVLLIGGSEGGLAAPQLAAVLAAHGFPTLAVAYFQAPGLPEHLSSIPLEYFERALTWLAARPEVDPEKVVVEGGSRGSEAALLLGVHDPDQVHAVIAASPSDAAGCSIPDCDGPAWTRGGRPVPYTLDWDEPHPTDVPGAVIPAQRIRGPVLEVCGERDRVWTSCAFARATMAQLDAEPSAPPHELVAVPDGDHLIDGLVPGIPWVSSPTEFTAQDQAADERALPDVWHRVLAFLAALP